MKPYALIGRPADVQRASEYFPNMRHIIDPKTAPYFVRVTTVDRQNIFLYHTLTHLCYNPTDLTELESPSNQYQINSG